MSTNERGFEDAIEASLLTEGGYARVWRGRRGGSQRLHQASRRGAGRPGDG